jgi:hypothetical protein
MKPGVAPGPSRLDVHRRFETNRFAPSSQARAYEEALPIVERRETKAAPVALRELSWLATEPLCQKGVAA